MKIAEADAQDACQEPGGSPIRLVEPAGLLGGRGGGAGRALGILLGSALGLEALNRIYADVHAGMRAADPLGFFTESLQRLGIRVSLTARDVEKIPARGPLLVVANHPWGAPEALAIGQALAGRRGDLRFVGNQLLGRIPEMRPWTMAVDPFGNPDAVGQNAAALMGALRHLRRGGAVVAFPAGEVAHLRGLPPRISEGPWSRHIGALVRLSRCRVLPVFFPGASSPPFNLAGLLHPRLRTLLLIRETLRLQGRTVRMLVGNPIPWSRLAGLKDDGILTDYLRFHTLFLKNRLKPAAGRQLFPLPRPWPRKVEPLAAAAPISLLRRELERLPPGSLLGGSGPLEVRLAEAEQIPMLLREIGRLREIAFRGVNEGSRRTIDCDRYDAHYLHLFLWHREREEVAGAYRIGLTDRILARFGPAGLYTYSLFRYAPEVLRRLGSAIELGRSFISPAYQRQSAPLALLWRGIGELAARRPHYRQLYGAVSIRHDYHVISKEIMVRFLRQRREGPAWSRRVKARRPFNAQGVFGLRPPKPLPSAVSDIEDLQLLVSELEGDGKGVPVLIRQYIKLNARFIGFNVDRRFSDVVDGLIHVDLDSADPRILKRFMGEEAFRRFFDRQAEGAWQG
jgi:putative hemolysin